LSLAERLRARLGIALLLVAAACTSNFDYAKWKKPGVGTGGLGGASAGQGGNDGSGGVEVSSGGANVGAAGETGDGGSETAAGGVSSASGGKAGVNGGNSAGGEAGARSHGGASGAQSSGGSAVGGAPGSGGSISAPLALTPPMGWNSWNYFSGAINEDDVREIANAMVDRGMRDAGYEYVVIDDTWQATSRDAAGALRSDPSRFPSGMAALADYVHARGLKFGLYSDRGTNTCAGRPGSYGHEAQDAATFAAWGVDFLKYDNCAIPAARNNETAMREDYTLMSNELRATGRPIVFSICAWWFRSWMPSVGHLWRTTTDIRDSFADNMVALVDVNGGDTSRYKDASYARPGIARFAGPGGWNDPDMLQVGNGGMTDAEYRAHFSLWAIMAAPLIAGNDVRAADPATEAILLNSEVIAIDQDPLGKQGVPISASITLEVWNKELAEPRTRAVVLFNRTSADAEIAVDFSALGLTSPVRVRDLWQHADLGEMSGSFSANVPSHGVVMLKVWGS